jgi:hypothetical protein
MTVDLVVFVAAVMASRNRLWTIRRHTHLFSNFEIYHVGFFWYERDRTSAVVVEAHNFSLTATLATTDCISAMHHGKSRLFLGGYRSFVTVGHSCDRKCYRTRIMASPHINMCCSAG